MCLINCATKNALAMEAITMPWTDEQQRAIEARNCDLLVAAAAGSGKTAVLVERIYKLVCEGADIERMLIVTFTNAVAAEMRERLATRFEELSDDERMRAQAQACLLYTSRCV